MINKLRIGEDEPDAYYAGADRVRRMQKGATRVYDDVPDGMADISNMTFGDALVVGATETEPQTVWFRADGQKLFLTGNSGADSHIRVYDLGTPWDLTTGAFNSGQSNFNVEAQEQNPTNIFFKPDGTRMFMFGITSRRIYQYNLGTPWDMTTISYSGNNFSVAGQMTLPLGMYPKPDGTGLFACGLDAIGVCEYTFGTPWDVTTLSFTGNTFPVAQETILQGVSFTDGGQRMFIVGSGNDTMYQYTLFEPYDLSTCGYDGISKLLTAQTTLPQDLFFNPDGSEVFVADSKAGATSRIIQYVL